MAQIEILSETELAAGWEFQAQLLDDEGILHAVRLTIAWADYNLWSPDGSAEPQHVAEAVLTYLSSQMPPAEIKSRLDAATVRRMYPNADECIPAFIIRRSL